MQNELAAFGYFEICGVVFALISVSLAIKEHRGCWPAAIISSLAYVPTFFLARLYTEVVLQFFFIAVSLKGWKDWEKKGVPEDLKISLWSPSTHVKTIIMSAFIAIIVGLCLKNFSNASFPFMDSLITVFSVTTSYMQARKLLESWVYWIIIDAAAILVYIQKGLLLTAGLYGLYLILASIGYWQWKQIKQKS